MFAVGRAIVGTPEEAIRRARLIWGIVLLGQAVFVVVIAFLITRVHIGFDLGDASRLLTRISLGLLVTVVPVALVVRRLLLRRQGEGKPAPPESYVRSTIIFLSLCEFVALFGLVVALVNGVFFPAGLASLVAIAVQVMNFPDGREMRPPAPGNTPLEPR